jgi:hypothetical protein
MRLAYLILPLTAAFGVSAIPMVRQAKPELQAASVLIAEDQQAISNEPASLQILVTPAPQNESLKVVGLAAGARLSAGVVVEGSSWQLPARDLNSVSIYPPADFVGTMHVMVALLSRDQKLLGLRPVRLQWIAKSSDSAQAGSPTESGYTNAVAVPPTDHGEDVAMQRADSSQLGDQTNSINTNAVAVQPTDHGEGVATQKADSSRLGDQANSINKNAVAVEPTKSGEDAAVQKADAALALIRELGIDGTRGKSRLRNLLMRHVQSQLSRSPPPDRNLNPGPSEFGQARL